MGSNWKRYSFEDCMEAIIDYRGKTPKKTTSGIPLITAKIIKNGSIQPVKEFIAEDDYESWMRRGIPKAGDVVLTTEAPLGEVAQLDERKIALAQRVITLRGKAKFLDNTFLKYLLISNDVQHQLDGRGTGTTVKGIKQSELRQLELPIPDFNTQLSIAKILGDLDKKIHLNNQTNQTLEQMAQALFKSWFVDFDPVFDNLLANVDFNLENLATSLPDELKQKAQRRLAALNSLHNATECKDSLSALAHELQAQTQASEQVLGKAAETPVKANFNANPKILTQHANTHAHFPSEFEHNEQLGWIPKGWVTKPFGELLENTIGGDWGKEFADEKHTIQSRIIRGTDIPALKSGGESKSPLRWVEEKKLKTRKIEFADIIIEISGGSPTQPTGRSIFMSQGIIKRLGGIIEPASFCRRFRPLDKKLGLLASVHLQKIYDDGKTWEYQNQSTGISNFQTKIFLENEVVLIPDNKVLGMFYNIAINFIDRKDLEESEVLTKLRDTLLPKLISGELQIPDVATMKK
ncbi:hypothetical protein PspMM1_03970 [Pseudoalteromonas sp. MM1]|uniref:restriction endonuclease subunit S n=1 Tax=Pseudoalteromonas sp. MM1 TaxID=3036714 RepID=UPI0025744DAA|nr:restriction endonuclease subunit S [Pseudoalteromonas sp. MM1]BED87929.1 hypothetical protein PspMM1_03970 [Pseudoalteromonas sp. MM1]